VNTKKLDTARYATVCTYIFFKIRISSTWVRET